RRRAWWLAGAVALALVALLWAVQAAGEARKKGDEAYLAALEAGQERDNANQAAATAQAEQIRANDAAATAQAEKSRADIEAEQARIERDKAEQQRRLAQFHALLAQAENLTDDELAALLGTEAINLLKTEHPDLILGEDTGRRLQDVMARSHLQATIPGHVGEVNAVAFSPDGQRFITAGDDGTAKIWEAKTGNLTLTLTGHYNPVLQAVWSPDGQRVVTAGDDGTAKIWNAQSGGGSLNPFWSL
ncbi:MAG: hypothetical protein HC875_17300, partial [Anaerolineales bacterium]|nr:hypothetical protein [Anaerolineales bacterium]